MIIRRKRIRKIRIIVIRIWEDGDRSGSCGSWCPWLYSQESAVPMMIIITESTSSKRFCQSGNINSLVTKGPWFGLGGLETKTS